MLRLREDGMRSSESDSNEAGVHWVEESEVAAVPKRRSAVQLGVLVAVLVAGTVALVAGAIVLLVGFLSPAAGCDVNGYCHDVLPLATVETYTGYDFPEGSEVLDSVHGTNNVTGISSMTATIAMPAGSVAPTSADSLSHIREQGTDDQGRTIVSVSTSDGSDGFPG